VQFQIGQIGQPNQSRQVLRNAVVHEAVITGAPYLCRFHPFRTIGRAILFVEVQAINAFGVAFESERAAGEMG